MPQLGQKKAPEETKKKQQQTGLSPLARILIGLLYTVVLAGGILLIYYLSTSGRS
jgi:hypothetical protein